MAQERLSFKVSPAMAAVLERLAEADGQTKGEVIRKALALLNFVESEKKMDEDAVFGVAGADGIIKKQLIIP